MKCKIHNTFFCIIESVWVPPMEGYLSIKEQKEEEYREAASQLKEVEKQKRVDGLQL